MRNKQERLNKLSQLYKACKYIQDDYKAIIPQIANTLSLPADPKTRTLGDLQAMVEEEDDDIKDAMCSIWRFKTTSIVYVMDEMTSIEHCLETILTAGAYNQE